MRECKIIRRKVELPQPYVLILLGLPASGKSTFARRLREKDDVVVLSSDDIREEMFGSRFSEEIREAVFLQMAGRAGAALRSGRNVVFDTTYLNAAESRDRMRGMLVGIPFRWRQKAFMADIETCVKRDSLRPAHRRVGRAVIERLAQTLDFSE